jgi:acetyl esterase/lipase
MRHHRPTRRCARTLALVAGTVALSAATPGFATDAKPAAASSTTTLIPLSDLPPATEGTFVYCTPASTPLMMDFYRPLGTTAVPVVLQVHGGGWLIGNRTTSVTASLVGAFLERGIAFATIDYRLGDGRAASNDVACAVRYLRAFATDLGIDPARIGAMGQSAGGQLVSLLGTADRTSGFDTGQYLDRSSRVQAVVDEWGPVIFDDQEVGLVTSIPRVFGSSDPAVLKQYSPLTYITQGDPPFLLVQGIDDAIVPASQSTRFDAALRAHGVGHWFLMVQNAGHYLQPSGGTPSPSSAQVRDLTVLFFDTVLHQ